MSPDKEQRNYIEVDLRPTIWCDYGKYIGNDPAVAIKAYFDIANADKSEIQVPFNREQKPPLQIAHYLRLNFFELLFNRYGIWKYMEGANLAICAHQYFLRQPINEAEFWIARAIKTRLSPYIWNIIRNFYLKHKSRIL